MDDQKDELKDIKLKDVGTKVDIKDVVIVCCSIM
tara:strand:+ start:2349 stop:2450 length:102 start_codon:yes stop_codon:yes gene_type:complete